MPWETLPLEPLSILLTQLTAITRSMIALLPQLAVALVVVVITWAVAYLVRRVVRRLLRRAHLRPSLLAFAVLMTNVATWIAGLTIAAVVVFPNLTPASVLTGLGIGSVAIGFAFKDIFENFLAGIFILLRREMRMGDFIECGDIEGVVEKIAIRETHVRQTDGQLVIVPNAELFKKPLTIVTDQLLRRTGIICGVAYGEDVEEALKVITDAVHSCVTVIKEPKPPQIFAHEFASSSIDFEVKWWTGSKPVDVRRSRSEVIIAIKKALDEAGIEIPFPYRTLTFKQPLEVERMETDQRHDRHDEQQ